MLFTLYLINNQSGRRFCNITILFNLKFLTIKKWPVTRILKTSAHLGSQNYNQDCTSWPSCRRDLCRHLLHLHSRMCHPHLHFALYKFHDSIDYKKGHGFKHAGYTGKDKRGKYFTQHWTLV